MNDRKGGVLIVEDEALVAFDLAELVRASGWDVIGPALSIPKARQMIDGHRPEVALLDIDVRGEKIWELAGDLRASGCTLIFVSAEPKLDGKASDFPGSAFLPKPASVPQIKTALIDAFRARRD